MKKINNNRFQSYFFNLLPVYFILVLSVNSYSQQVNELPKESNELNNDSTSLNQDSSVISVKLKAVKFSLENIFDTLSITDTLLGDEFPYFNDLDRIDYPIIDNGYIGSSAMPIDGFDYGTGFKFGLNQYRLYNIEEKYFHITNVPLTTLYFSPGSKPSEFTTRAKFSKNFKDVSLDINYARISNIGKYKGQINKHTNLDFGFWKGKIGNRFNTFVNIIANVHEENQNGGVSNADQLYQGGYSYRQSVFVNLDNANVRFDSYKISITEYYRIKSKGVDYFSFTPYLIGNLDLSRGFYKYFDVETIGDSIVYKAYLIDGSGLRNYLNFSRINLDLSLFGYSKMIGNVKFGLKYKRSNYNHEPLGELGFNEFFLYSKAKINILENVNVDFDSKVHFGDFKGDYKYKLKAKYTNRYFDLCASIKRGLYSPSFYNDNLWLSRKNVYTKNFDKIGEMLFAGKISINRLGFSAYVEKHLISNYIYYNDELLPIQLTERLDYLKINLKEKIKLWVFHLDNSLYMFNSSSDLKPLPGYTLRSKFYVSPFLFKRHLLLKTGFEFNFWDKYYNYGFNPILGNYYVQNEIELDNFNRLDFFISAKIDDFLFYARFNNILFNTGIKVPFKVLNYPQNDLFFRIGVQWTLVQ